MTKITLPKEVIFSSSSFLPSLTDPIVSPVTLGYFTLGFHNAIITSHHKTYILCKHDDASIHLHLAHQLIPKKVALLGELNFDYQAYEEYQKEKYQKDMKITDEYTNKIFKESYQVLEYFPEGQTGAIEFLDKDKNQIDFQVNNENCPILFYFEDQGPISNYLEEAGQIIFNLD